MNILRRDLGLNHFSSALSYLVQKKITRSLNISTSIIPWYLPNFYSLEIMVFPVQIYSFNNNMYLLILSTFMFRVEIQVMLLERIILSIIGERLSIESI